MASACITLRVLVVVFLAALVIGVEPVPAGALGSKDSACRNFIGTKVGTLADTIIREQVKCNQNRARGALDASVDCNDPDNGSFPGASAVATAASKLATGITTKCSAASTPAANGYSSCPSPCSTLVPSVTSYSDGAACLICETKAAATTVFQLAYGTSPPIQGAKDSAWKCPTSAPECGRTSRSG